MAPTPIAQYQVYSGGNNTNALVTPSFTPANGEVMVVKAGTWDTAVSMGTPTGGSQTYQNVITVAPGGFKSYCIIWVVTVAGTPGPMTVTSSPSATCQHWMTVERWGSAQLSASPHVNSVTVGNNSAPSASLTTETDNSVISFISVDINSIDPTGHTYLLSATEDLLFDGHVGANDVAYGAYASVGAAGAYTFGLSSPGGQSWVMGGVEVRSASVAPTTTPDVIYDDDIYMWF